MTAIEARRIVLLGKKNGVLVMTKQDPEVPHARLVVIDGFYYDNADAAASDILNV